MPQVVAALMEGQGSTLWRSLAPASPVGGAILTSPLERPHHTNKNPNEGMRLKMPPKKKPRPGVLPRLSLNLDDLADIGDEQNLCLNILLPPRAW